ncbi:ArpU family phage packaging/lysis transcriptional regulator [Parageobacillus thermoglucosidasius]|uniref:ArpU family transcriptional regulator n=1 Tax=Parageobacillus thermoglucosidasius TaxID=1426 RepID=A0A1B7KP80_PARTM|nr:ArpU family phage packaging/lysis transcriptional regulator [Parageobacillus thermoglucosidasius]OAT71894.1 ArpU family transcriptional regulator [Parageobacillus thermoglucosidasius]
MKQMTFQLPEIDREETKKRVEAALEKYRFYLLTVPEEQLPKVTATYSLVPPAHTNAFYSSTEIAVIDKVDFERERDEYMEWIRRGVNRLSPRERELIIKRYLSNEEMYDYELYNDMGMSERKYYRIKSRAFYKLAFALKIEVYKKEESEVISP